MPITIKTEKLRYRNPDGTYTEFDAVDGSGTPVDAALSPRSENPVQNKVITEALNQKQDKLDFDVRPVEGSLNPVTSGGLKAAIESAKDAVKHGANLGDSVEWTNYSRIVWSTGAKVTNETYENFCSSGYVSLDGIQKLLYLRLKSTTSSATATHGIAFYSAANESSYLSGVASTGKNAESSEEPYVVEVPSGANYVRFTYWSDAFGHQPFYAYDPEEAHTLDDAERKIDNIKNYLDVSLSPVRTASEDAPCSVYPGIINSAGSITIGSNRTSYEAENNDYRFIYIEAEAEQAAYLSFLTASIEGATTGSAMSFCVGESRRTIAAGESAVFDVPSDCRYIVISKSTGNNSLEPKAACLYGKDSALVKLLDKKQDSLTIDATPTTGSTNPVASGGVKSELDELKSSIDDIVNGLAQFEQRLSELERA